MVIGAYPEVTFLQEFRNSVLHVMISSLRKGLNKAMVIGKGQSVPRKDDQPLRRSVVRSPEEQRLPRSSTVSQEQVKELSQPRLVRDFATSLMEETR